MIERVRSQRGQAAVLTLVFLTVLLAMAAFVLDVGAWFRADRDTQSTADAAALAAAQALPTDTGRARSLAQQYATRNGGGSTTVSFSSSLTADDTVTVRVSRLVDAFFSKLFGVNSIEAGSRATARTALMAKARYVAPIVVRNTHPKLWGPDCPCFGSSHQTTLPLGPTGAPGAFALLNLDGSRGGTGPATLASWMLRGFDGYLDVGDYFSDPGAKFDSSEIQSALNARIGTELLFPVYDNLTGTGANARYHIIGWVGFHLLSFSARGNSGSLTGYFTQVIWKGIQVSSASQTPNFGARSVQLID